MLTHSLKNLKISRTPGVNTKDDHYNRGGIEGGLVQLQVALTFEPAFDLHET